MNTLKMSKKAEVRLFIRVPFHVKARIQSKARKDGVSIAEWVRGAIERASE